VRMNNVGFVFVMSGCIAGASLIANGSRVTATIDLGVVLGQHVYTFGF
jgi:hypothetical protein